MRFSGRLQTAANRLIADLTDSDILNDEALRMLTRVISDKIPQAQKDYCAVSGKKKQNVARTFKRLQKAGVLEEVQASGERFRHCKSYDFTLHFILKAWEHMQLWQDLGRKNRHELLSKFDYYQDSECLRGFETALSGYPDAHDILNRYQGKPVKVPVKNHKVKAKSSQLITLKSSQLITQSNQRDSAAPENHSDKKPRLGDNRRQVEDQKTPDQSNLYNDITYIDKKCTKKCAESGEFWTGER